MPIRRPATEGEGVTVDPHRKLMNAVEHAIENELDSFTTEEVRNNRGYVAECVATRLYQDEFLREP